ncbi:radical SAM protein [Methanopyrus sp.]
MTVDVTAECPHGCPHCNLRGTGLSGHLDPKVLEGILSEVMDRFDLEFVILTGGEPCLHPRFGELVDLCRRFDAGVGVNVATEVHPALADVDHVYVALEPHRGYGLEGARETWEEVVRLEPDGVFTNTVVCRDTFRRLREVNKLAVELGAEAHFLIAYVPSGPDDPLDDYPHDEVPGIVRDLERAYLAGMPFQEEVPFSSCRHGEFNLHVRVDGRLTPCQHWKGFVLEDLDEFEGLQGLEPVGPCRGCPRFGECQGGCNAYAWNVAGRVMPDPRCPRVRGGSGSPGCGGVKNR